MVDNLLTNIYCVTKTRKLDGVKVPFCLIKIIYFATFALCSEENCLTLSIFGYHSMLTCILQSNFAADYCLHLYRLRSPTPDAVSKLHQIPKDTNFHQQRCTNLPWRNPIFTVHVISGHTQNPTYCCSFNWKGKLKENILCKITRTLDTGYLLCSGLGRFIPWEEV